MSRSISAVRARRPAIRGGLLLSVAVMVTGCGASEPSAEHRASSATANASPATTSASGTPAAPASACGMPQVKVVSARRVGRGITVRWAVAGRPPAACGRVAILVTARSLTAAMPAMGARDSRTGSEVLLRDLSGTTAISDIIGPIMPPYEADVSLFSERGERIEARGPVSATDDPGPEQVRAEIKRREACQAGAGRVGECRLLVPDGVVDSPLTGVTAVSLARAVTKRISSGYGDDLDIKSVTCTPAWSCSARLTLNWGREPIRVTYRLRGGGRPACWRVSGWHVAKAGSAGTALPNLPDGCVGDP